MKLKKLPNLCSRRTKKEFDFDLPVDYVVSKFYEYGFKVSYNRFAGNYQSCCPICREGKSWGRKKRCFYIPDNKNIYCHNCGSSLTPYNWIREVSGMSHKEIEDELNNSSYDTVLTKDKTEILEIPTLPEDSINLFDDLQVEFYKNHQVVKAALQYIEKRRLNTAINKPDALYISLKDKFQPNRLIIPFKNEEGKIIFYQTRKIFDWDDKPDYLSKFNADKTIFGFERIDPQMDTVFLFEGPIDSCFIKNGLGVAGINTGHFTYTRTQQEQMLSLSLFEKIWILDSQWIDDTAREKTLSLLETGEKVFIWPKIHGQKFKDFNAMCVGLGVDSIPEKYVKKNTTQGMSGILKFKMMFK